MFFFIRQNLSFFFFVRWKAEKAAIDEMREKKMIEAMLGLDELIQFLHFSTFR